MLSHFRASLEIGALLAIADGFYAAVLAGFLRGRWTIDTRRWLSLGHLLVAASIALPIAATLLPKETLFRPAAQIWSGAPKVGSEKYALLASAAKPPTVPSEGAG